MIKVIFYDNLNYLLSLVREFVVDFWEPCKQKLNGEVLTTVTVVTSVTTVTTWLGKWMVSYMYVPQVREEQMVRICLYIHVCMALAMIFGAWLMQ